MLVIACKHDIADLLGDKKIVAPIIPEVVDVTASNADGTYSIGSPISIQIVFNTNVVVTGTPQLVIQTGNPTTTTLDYTSGSGSNTLVFTYTVVALNSSPDLDYASTSALGLNGGSILGTTGIAAVLILAAPGASGSLGANKNLVINTTVAPPKVTNVSSSTANGTYGPGSTISIQVKFDANVTVTGTPQLTLATGTPATTAVNCSQSAVDTLTCSYTIVSGNNSADLDYASTTALALNGGNIVAVTAPNPAALLALATPGAANSLGANAAIVVDGVAPTITDVTSSNGDGAYGIGSVISIQVTFSKTINVTGGTPQLTLTTGSPATTTINCTGTATTTLSCSYTVASGNNSSDLAYASTSAFSLNGSTIRDGYNNDATLTLPSVGAAHSLDANKNIVVDGVLPNITNVTSSTADDVYTVGQTISIQVVFSEAITVAGGIPTLALNSGAASATYLSVASNTMNFSYTVSAGQNVADLDYASSAALTLNGATIRDAANNDATLTLFAPAATGSLGANKNIKIDTTAPTVVNVTSPNSNGNYNTSGDTIDIQVVFSKAVNMAAPNPTLLLQKQSFVLLACTGTPSGTWTAGYLSGSGTNTLVFRFTLTGAFLLGDCSTDLNYFDQNSLQTTGTIQDVSGITATLTLPPVAGAGSLGTNKNIKIND